MAYRRLPLTQLASRVAVAIGVLLFAAGSVLVFMIPRDGVIDKAYDKPTQAPISSLKPDPVIPPSPSPKKVTPSKPKKTSVPVIATPPVSKPSHPTATVKPTSPKPRPKPPSATPKSTSTKPSTPAPTASVSTPPPVPSTSPVTSPPSGTVWYTSPVAVAAAQRMAALQRVGDPVCSLASYGDPDPSLIPSDVKSVGIGESDDYYCLIW